MTTSSNDNLKAFSAWLLSCMLALALILAVLGAMYPAWAGPGEAKMREFVDSYYRAVAAGDDAATYEFFSADALFRFEMDFGFMFPDYEVEFRADETGTFDESMFEGYEVLATDYSIEAIELSETGALVRATLRQPYRWSGSEGNMTAQETLTIETVEGVYLITRLQSVQEYK